MRYIYSVFTFLLCAFMQAQTITQSFNEPVIGDVDKMYRLDTSAYANGLPVAATGSTCSWDYSALVGVFPLVVDSFITPTAAPNYTNYAGVTYVQHRDPLYTFYKSDSSPQETELLGAYSPSLTLTFTNSAIIASYPIAYGYSLSDPVSGSFKANSTTGACNGNITISANGLGTIKLSSSTTFSNVICLKSVEILTLSAGILPFGTFNQTIYNYYAPGKKFPVLNINYTTYQLIAGTPTTTAFIYGSSNYFTVAGIPQNQLDPSDYRAFPNPFHEQLFIRAQDPLMENEYLLYNSNGALITRTKTLTDIGSGLVSGIYLLEVRNKSGVLHQKVIKE